jgi:hypothetical protein
MSRWYAKVVADPNDLSPVLDAYDWFEKQYEEANKDLDTNNKRIEEIAKRLAGMVEYRYGQLQEVEAIFCYLERREKKALGDARRRYLEHYKRNLTDTMATKYAEADDDVIAFAALKEQIGLIRNKFLGLSKGYEILHFQLTNITKLRVAGIEDAML